MNFQGTGPRGASEIGRSRELLEKEREEMTRIISFAWRCARSGTVAGLGLATLLGCGEDDGIGTRYPVSGTVMYNGEPLKSGTVNFTPDGAEGRPAAGDIASDGSYRVTTLTRGDGMLPGKYKVAIQANYTDMTKVVDNPGGLYRSDLKRKAPQIKVAPEKYASPATSDLTAEIKPESNTLNFELEDGPPPPEPIAKKGRR
jgi:hypothetical protein